MQRITFFVLTTAMIILATGCGKESLPVVEVTGRVLYQGKPLEGAAVLFYAETDQRSCSGTTDANGVYNIYTAGTDTNGAMPGNYRVAIKKVVNINASEKKEEATPYNPAKPTNSRPPVLKNLLPEKWGDPEQSGFSAQVVKGKNTFDFELE
ncbi:MAG: hypothetical protein Q4G68_05555 [Planctomycetia bacterium]|nr:hypothetical protein [Planctomycetia bacterium]